MNDNLDSVPRWLTPALLCGTLMAAGCGPSRPIPPAERPVAIPCTIQEGDLEFHDLLTACHFARERFQVLFGLEPHPAAIVIWDTTAMDHDFRDGRATISLPSRRAVARARAAFSRATTDTPDDPLLLATHELMHALLAAGTVGGEFGPLPEAAYGTVLPDWFDEGVAIWAEPEQVRTERLQRAAGLPAAMLDLNGFARLDHPRAGATIDQRSESALYQCNRPPCPPNAVGRDTFLIISRIDQAGLISVDTLLPEDPGFLESKGDEYYTIASTILPFLHRTGGSRLIRIILDRMLAEPGRADVFADLPGLPSDTGDVNRAWIRFVRSLAPDTTLQRGSR